MGTDFEVAWKAYPRKTAKKIAAAAWAKHQPPLQAVLDAIAWQRQQEQWQPNEKGEYRFVPHFATYINQGRWEDECPAALRPKESQEDWYAQCQRLHAGACGLNRMAHHIRMQKERLTEKSA